MLAKIAVAAVCTALLSATDAQAQRQRIPPPEPSLEAWISPAAVERLQQAIAFHQRIVSAGGWPALPNRITLRPGDKIGRAHV
jgi:hypothetical protein